MQKYSQFYYIPTLHTENEVPLHPTVMLQNVYPHNTKYFFKTLILGKFVFYMLDFQYLRWR